MNYHLFLSDSDLPITDEPAILVVATCSTQVTRAALVAAESRPNVVGVTGWVDISAPNLVDLLDDLTRGQGGTSLIDLRVRLTDQDIQNVPTQRGLAIAREAGLGIRFETERTDIETQQFLDSFGARPLPSLNVP